MSDRIPLPYPYRRATYRLYLLTGRHPVTRWLTAPLWRARWQLFIWRGRRDARRLVPVCGDRPITDFLWSVDE